MERNRCYVDKIDKRETVGIVRSPKNCVESMSVKIPETTLFRIDYANASRLIRHKVCFTPGFFPRKDTTAFYGRLFCSRKGTGALRIQNSTKVVLATAHHRPG